VRGGPPCGAGLWCIGGTFTLLPARRDAGSGQDVSTARQLASTGSLSGAIIGGLMFGAGMIFARGCASRLLVLSASGNLRAIVTGLVLTLTAQAALTGVLAPVRETLAGLWTVQGGAERHLFGAAQGAQGLAVILAPLGFGAAFLYGRRAGVQTARLLTASLVGLCVCAGWIATYAIAAASFEVIEVQSLTFTGPSTDTLMALVNDRSGTLSFGQGLVIGVALGAFAAAVAMREARLQRFEPDVPMERYLIGGVLMGFGAMLAGGCAVGAGLSGGAILSLTAWVAVFCMWLGAVATQLALNASAGRHLQHP